MWGFLDCLDCFDKIELKSTFKSSCDIQTDLIRMSPGFLFLLDTLILNDSKWLINYIFWLA